MLEICLSDNPIVSQLSEYLMTVDPQVAKRNWQHVMEEILKFRVRLKKEIGGVLAESDGQINAQNT